MTALLPFLDAPPPPPSAASSSANSSPAAAEESGLAGLFALQLLALLSAADPAPQADAAMPEAEAGRGEEVSEDAPPEASQAGRPEGSGEAGNSLSDTTQAASLRPAVALQPDQPDTHNLPSGAEGPAAPQELVQQQTAADSPPESAAGSLEPPRKEATGATVAQPTADEIAVASEKASRRSAPRRSEYGRSAVWRRAENNFEAAEDQPPVENFPRLWKTAESDPEQRPAAEGNQAASPTAGDPTPNPLSVARAAPESTTIKTAQESLAAAAEKIQVAVGETEVTDLKQSTKVDHKVTGEASAESVEKFADAGRRAQQMLARWHAGPAASTLRGAAEPARAGVWAERLTAVEPDGAASSPFPTVEKPSRSTSFPQGAAIPEPPRSSVPLSATGKPVAAETSPETVSHAGASSGEDPAQGGDRQEPGSRHGTQEFAGRRPLPERFATPLSEAADAKAEATERRPAAVRPPLDRGASEDGGRSAAEPPTAGRTESPTPAAEGVERSARPSPDGPAAPRGAAPPQPVAPQPPANSAAPAAEPPALRAFDASPAGRPAPPLTPSAERVDAALQVAASELRRSPEATRLTLRLEDDRLGTLALRLAERGGGVEVMLRADNATAAKQFQNNLPQLYESLLQRGLQPEARPAWTPSASPDADRRQHEQEHRERETRQPFRGRRSRNSNQSTTFSIPVS